MAVSARNQLTGTVSAVAMGAVNDEVELTLAGGAKLVAIVTHSSQQALGLAKGKEAIALIKAPWVTLATEDCGLKFSARNQFAGSVSTITEGAVNATVHIKTDAGFEIVAVVTNESQDEMKLTTGSRVIALIKASAILIATSVSVAFAGEYGSPADLFLWTIFFWQLRHRTLVIDEMTHG